MTKQYEQRDIEALDEAGGYYFRHVEAMTSENLRNKSEIAAELGYRDMKIDELFSEVSRLKHALGVIANSEPNKRFTIVCDFDLLVSVACGALTDELAEEEAKAIEKALAEVIEFIDRDSGLAVMKTRYELSSAIVEYVQKLREGRGRE